MSEGILIGYFEPLHLGHLRDINHAVGKVDKLHIVVLARKDKHPKFNPTLESKARHVQVACEFFDFVKVHTANSLDLKNYTSWSYDEDEADINPSLQQQIYQALQLGDSAIIFSKNKVYQNLEDTGFDSKLIYQSPISHFDKIAPSARPDYVQTVCITGGESSGKTTLVHKLANHYGASFALEMGRLYTHSDLGGTEIGLQYSDYPNIANQHFQAIITAKKQATAPIVIVDTDFITTQAFCETYENRTHPLLTAFCQNVKMDHTIMLNNNVAWVADGMRSLGSSQNRSAFAKKLLELFTLHQVTPYFIGDKDYHERFLQAVAYIDSHVLKD